ncbi:hypothetical protein NDI43_19620 [Microcoleus vaginatus GB2-A3]|uniref:hypothetical protein n=1 Tax=Microcoleus vaginatus TaxID=119532 RepID=UPI0032A42E38
MLILLVFMVTGFELKPGFLFICLRYSCRFPFVLDRDLSAFVPFACIILVVGDRADVPSLPVPVQFHLFDFHHPANCGYCLLEQILISDRVV